jgi:hypothetical protein
VRLAPRYRAGQTLHYQIDFRTQTASRASGVVENPQGAAQIDLAVSLLVRLEVLSTLPATAADPFGAPRAAGEDTAWCARMRATYEKSSVAVRGDSYDPAVVDLEAQYRHLEGRAVEFTLAADGTVNEVTGLDEILRDEKSASAVRGWLGQLAAGSGNPRGGIAPGETWSSEKHLDETPLADTVLDSRSTYLRDEKCRASVEPAAVSNSASASDAPDSAEMCAVVVTRSEMKQRGKPRGPGQDATPDSLRRRGLRSSGTWTASGESLVYLSLKTGLTVSVTQSGAEDVNLEIIRTAGGAPYRIAARIQSETHITLLSEAATPKSASLP